MKELLTQVHDGEWVDVTDGTVTSCCGCGMVHIQRFVVLDGRILRMIHLDSRRTYDRRRTKLVKESIEELKLDHWITVDKGLPKNGQVVDVMLDVGLRKSGITWRKSWRTCFCPYKITHWKLTILPEKNA